MLTPLTVLLAALLALVVLRIRAFGFLAQRPAAYAATGPAFDPSRVLNGALDSEGVIYGPTGRVVSRFVMRMEGRWDGARGRLTEHFRYDSGQEQAREWDLTLHNDGRLTATAPDIIGEAEGVVSGATLRLRYRIRLPGQAGGHVLDVTDWLYLMPNGTVMNRSQMRRFGLTLAELIATMRPDTAGSEAA